MTQLDIHLMGSFLVTHDGKTVKGLDQSRIQSLFAYLLLHADARIPRQQLAYTFWPDSDEKQALNNLRTLLYRLRQNLPESDRYLELDRHTVRWLHDAPFTLDVTEFEEAVAQSLKVEADGNGTAARAALQTAVTLYKGDLLPASYEEWVETYRERLRQTFIEAVNRLLIILEAGADYAQAIKFARLLLQMNPLSESTYQRLMHLQVASGDRVGALQTFEQVQKMLAEELGVDPSPKTLELHIRTLQDELGMGSERRAQEARAVAEQRDELESRYDRLIRTNVLMLELQREREEKTKLLQRLEGAASGKGSPLELPEPAGDVIAEDSVDPALCPYKGLVAYEEDDAAFFFGREEFVAELVARLAGAPFLTMIGPSGSGKSSVVRAGLLPALREDGLPGSRSWATAVLTPGAHPLAALAVTVSTLTAVPAGKIYKQLPHNRYAVAESIVQSLAEVDDEVRYLIVVDQVEEVFALCREETERAQFFENLLRAVIESGRRCLVAITIRADFYGRLADYPDLAATQKDSILLGPLDDKALRQVIEEPAQLAGLQLEPGLADTILQDAAGEPGALPLLSHALLETWRRRDRRLLTLAGYQASGGIRGAIAQTAESVYSQLTPEQQIMTRRIFLRLTELGDEGTQDTRRRVAPEELVLQTENEAAVAAVLKTLADARLITTGEGTVEVAHEALIREWPKLRQWLEDDREGLRIHRHLTETAAAWSALDQDPGELYRGVRLAAASEWAKNQSSRLNPLEREFLAASQALAQQRELEREEQRQAELAAAQRVAAAEKRRAEEQARASSRLRRLVIALAVVFVLAVAAALFAQSAQSQARTEADIRATEVVVRSTAEADALANEQLAQSEAAARAEEVIVRSTAEAEAVIQEEEARSQQATAVAEAEQRATAQSLAEEEQQIAFSRELAAAAQANLNQDPELSLLLALQALDVTHTLAAENTLHQAIVASRVEKTLSGHTVEALALAYSQDGKRLISGGGDNTARIWDVGTGELLHTFTGFDDWVVDVSFDPEDQRVAASSYDGVFRIWDATTYELQLELRADTESPQDLDFSPDGRLLVASGLETVLWDLDTGQKVITIPEGAENAAFSPDGQTLAVSSDDFAVRLYNVENGEEIQSLSGHTDWVEGLNFSPDGRLLATEGNEGIIRIWNVDRSASETFGQQILMFTGAKRGSSGSTVEFSPDGRQLFALGADKRIKIWDVETGQELPSLLCHPAVNAMAISPDGSQVAVSVAGEEAVIKLCQMGPSYEWLTVAGHTDRIYHSAFSPEGGMLYTTSRDGSAKAWNVTEPGVVVSGQEQVILKQDGEGYFNIKVSPDGSRLALAGLDGLSTILDAASGEELLQLASGEGNVLALAFNPNGSLLATGGVGETVGIWDATTGEKRHTLTGYGDAVWEVVFSPDGSLLATASADQTIRIWDVTTGEEIAHLEEPLPIFAVSFTPDGKYLATSGNEGVIRLWPVDTLLEGKPAEPRELRGHGGLITDLAFSPDGTRLASAGFSDFTIRLWDVTSGQQLLELPGYTDRVWGVEFSPDGKYLASSSWDSTVRVYALDLEQLIALARERVTRSLTDTECRQYLHLDTCPAD